MHFLNNLNWSTILQITIVDFLLASDNAIILAIVCQKLPVNQRRYGLLFGIVCALILRACIILFSTKLFFIPGLKITGGILLLWVGSQISLSKEKKYPDIQSVSRLINVIKLITITDLIMSFDNIIAIVGVVETINPKYQASLIAISSVVSIPIMLLGSQLLIYIINRIPWIIIIGSIILGWIGGGLIFTDLIIKKTIFYNLHYGLFIAHIAGIIYIITYTLIHKYF